ncbi:MAG: GFA family protein [Henriciella sp.]|nr:GFA family protein [Henriciella sp.]
MQQHIHEGRCDCGHIHYRMIDQPLIVHACHCRACQRQTGSTNAVNVLIEKHKVELLSGEVTEQIVPTPTGYGQQITRCAKCKTVVWSEYLIFAERRGAPVRFIRAGTLDDPGAFPPDVHIFTSTRQPHLNLSGDVPVYPEFYDIKEVWSAESYERFRKMKRENGRRLITTTDGSSVSI